MQLEVGTIIEGKVTGITSFGAFIELPDNKKGMVHISEVAHSFVNDINDHLKIGDIVKVKIININDKDEIALSIKKAMENTKNIQRRSSLGSNRKRSSGGVPNLEWNGIKKSQEPSNFEDMMAMFKHASEERMSDLKRSTESKRGSFSKRGSQR